MTRALDTRTAEVLRYFTDHPGQPRRTAEVAADLDIDRRQVSVYVARLARRGLIDGQPSGKRGQAALYAGRVTS